MEKEKRGGERERGEGGEERGEGGEERGEGGEERGKEKSGGKREEGGILLIDDPGIRAKIVFNELQKMKTSFHIFLYLDHRYLIEVDCSSGQFKSVKLIQPWWLGCRVVD